MLHIYNFPMLPTELSSKIYSFVLENAAELIRKKWYNYIYKKIIITKLFLDITSNNYRHNINHPNIFDNSLNYINNYQEDVIDCFNYHVLIVLKYCNKVLSGKEDRQWWLNKLRIIANSIYFYYDHFNHTDLTKQGIYMNICLYYKKIQISINFT